MMNSSTTVTVNGKAYSVTLQRFDDFTEPGGPSYHGWYVTIEGHGLDVFAAKYEDEDDLGIRTGIPESASDAIEIVRDIARQMFATSRLSLLTDLGYHSV